MPVDDGEGDDHDDGDGDGDGEPTSLFGDAAPIDDESDIQTSGEVEIDDSPQGSERRRIRKQYPAPVSWLVEYESDRYLIDWAIERYLDGDDSPHTKSDISDATGVSRKTIIRRIDKHITIGVFGVDDSRQYERYYVRDSDVMRALVQLNEAVLDAYPDDPKQLPDT